MCEDYIAKDIYPINFRLINTQELRSKIEEIWNEIPPAHIHIYVN